MTVGPILSLMTMQLPSSHNLGDKKIFNDLNRTQTPVWQSLRPDQIDSTNPKPAPDQP